MEFSVLISVYFKENPEYLHQSLESVFNQSVPPNEVILVEDGLLPLELEGVIKNFQEKYPILKIIKLKKNKGLGKALNEGLKYCSYPLVARMDSDDICFPERFEKQYKFMNDNPSIDICSAWIEEFEEDIKNVKSVKKVPESHEDIAQYIGKRNPINHPAVMFRKAAVLKVNGYMHFPLFEDWYLWARMFVIGAQFANIQEPLLHFRTSSQMFKRRGGFRYAKDSCKFQWTLYKLGIISSFDAIKANILRTIVYLLPNKIRSFVYSRFLRN